MVESKCFIKAVKDGEENFLSLKISIIRPFILDIITSLLTVGTTLSAGPNNDAKTRGGPGLLRLIK